MEERNYWQRISGSRLSRRRVMAGAALGGLGLTAMSLIGCGEDETATPTAAATSTPSGTATATATGDTGAAANTTLIESTAGDHATLHPWKNQGGLPTNSHVNFMEGLVFRNEKGEMFNALAESYEETPDHLNWTFKLRPNTFFHNGEPITAEDVKYSWENGGSAETASPFMAYLAGIGTVEAPDAQTVTVKMANPDAIFLQHIAYASGPAMIIPKAYHEQVGVDGFEQAPIGAGFFKFDSREPGNFTQYTRFDQYWRGPTKFGGLRFNVVAELSTRSQLLETNASHVTDQMTSDSATTLAEKGFGTPSVEREPIWYNFRMANVKNPAPEFQDLRVRQAFNLAIDKDAITAGVYKGFATPVSSMAMRAVPGYPAREPYAHDVAEAKKLLDAAGFDYNKEYNAESPTGRFPQMETAAQAMQANFAEAGIKVKLNLPEYATWLKDITNHESPEWDLMTLNFGNLLYDNGGVADGSIKTGGTWSFISDPAIDAIIAALPTTFGDDARAAAFAGLFELIHDQAYGVFLWELKEIFGTNPNLTWEPCCAWRFHSYYTADLRA